MNIKDQIKTLIIGALKKINVLEKVDVVIESTKDKKNGDFSSNIAMQLSKELAGSPIIIAKKIIESIEPNDIISKIEVAGPGFINIFLNKKYLLKEINEVINLNGNYGKSNIGNNKKTNVEFVSANPTGTLHLGTARGASFGDNLCRILEYVGFDVTREYYINDAGNQIDNLGLSIKTRYLNICGNTIDMPKDGYYGKEIITIAQDIYNKYKDTKQQESIEFFKELGVEILLKKIEEDLNYFRVHFDVWTSEKDIRKSGNIEKSLEILRNNNNIYEQDGATWLRTTKYGDDKDRVIIKSDGEYTYLVPDIAYHLDKINRGYDVLIDVLGADHHGYVSRLKASIEALGKEKEKLDVKLMQMVKLIKDGEEIKMSKRTGETVTIRELIDEVGCDAARYFFAMRNLDTQMDFDIDLATKKSNENPVYYVQYAHARICSIIKGANNRSEIKEYKTIISDYAFDLLSKIYEFKEIVENAAIKQTPHLITNYLYELATLFHSFYTNEKILTEDDIYTNERLAVIECVKITIKNALNLIGVTSPEEM
jgi:arginyl-tRNA synthetase